MVDADRSPVFTRSLQSRDENPPRCFDIETGIMHKPLPDFVSLAMKNGSELWHPETIDLKRPKIMGSIAVGHIGSNPAPFLISQPP